METELGLDELDALLEEPESSKREKSKREPRRDFTAIMEKQNGPLRFHDTEHRCASRGCGSSTWLKVRGISRCMMHALKELNDLCIEAGVE